MYLLARNEEINQWLAENPLVLGGGALALGALLLFFGIRSLMTGQASGKWGQEYEGGMAYAMGGIRAVAGGLVLLFGLYKIATAFF
jgi:hypothetical protein